MPRARIIYNPTSGREIIKHSLVDILNILEQTGYETSTFSTTKEPLSAEKEAYRVSELGFDLVVAAGGDGTVNEVVNGIAKFSKKPKLAIIPTGTTNDYARALKLPLEDPIAAVKTIVKGKLMKTDIGLANNSKYFINIAAGGLLTELTYDVPSDAKSTFGYLAYLIKGAGIIPQLKPVEMELEFDGDKFAGKASMFFLALTNSIGGFEQIVPDAKLDDGNFTVIIVKTGNIPDILHLIIKILSGDHVNDPRIIYKKAQKVKVVPVKSNIMINLDGEYGGDAPMSFQNLSKHLEIFVNL